MLILTPLKNHKKFTQKVIGQKRLHKDKKVKKQNFHNGGVDNFFKVFKISIKFFVFWYPYWNFTINIEVKGSDLYNILLFDNYTEFLKN